MAINTNDGTPFVGYVSLTNGAPGPVNFALFTVMGQAAYTLSTGSGATKAERCVITNITVSTNDTTAELVTIDTGGTTPTKLASCYVSNVIPPVVESVPPGMARGIFGVVPRATASAVSAGKTIECVIKGYITQS